MQSDSEDDINELFNDSDTEFIASNVIKPACNPDIASVLTPKPNVHVVDEGTHKLTN